ncbi:hypothetical protein N0V84_012488 [Fusarium piperis]|uniref:LysM domain-containing protein n=1 Tax=Fusarium piperis TaxID=1435070 RepID=A0A9W8W3I8_9HYPO|nr:hypothetical protein N0V84_012488 [Fusarium piperis]
MATLKHLFAFGLFFVAGAFRIYEAKDLDMYDVGEACVNALPADIACNPYIRDFMGLSYRGSLENVTLTDEICTGTCSASLRKWVDMVCKDCASEALASNIIDEFSEVDDGEEMPREELCHICYQRRLAIMQPSQYSIYDEYYKEQLENVYKTCGGSGPTDIPLPLKAKEEETTFCLTSKYFTTNEGDTCGSISKAEGVSGYLLYVGNKEPIGNCLEVPEGLKLCMTTTCKTYYVQPGDTRFSIETSLGIGWDAAKDYNSGSELTVPTSRRALNGTAETSASPL